jgi:hypothetical protein
MKVLKTIGRYLGLIYRDDGRLQIGPLPSVLLRPPRAEMARKTKPIGSE